MGSVIKFKARCPKDQASATNNLNRLSESLIALATQAKAIQANKPVLEKELLIFNSMILNAENPNLRAKLRERLTDIHDQLLLASLRLLDAKRMIEGTLVDPITDPHGR